MAAKQERREFAPGFGAENIASPEDYEDLQTAFDYVDRQVDKAHIAYFKTQDKGVDTTKAKKEYEYWTRILYEIRSCNMDIVRVWANRAREEKKEEDNTKELKKE